MKKMLYSIIRISFSLAAALGILFSLAGIVIIWRYVPVVSERLMDGAVFVQSALDSSEDLLDIAQTTLTQTQENVALLADATEVMADSLNETSSMASSISNMMEDKFIGVVENTQSALTSLETSAKLVDDTLAFIASIPLLGTKYSNQTPLYNSVVEINENLSDIPANMRDMQTSLDATASAITLLNEKVDTLTANVSKIETNVTDAKTVVTTYQELVNKAQGKITYIIDRLPHWVDWAAIGLTLLLVWAILIQAGLLLYVQDIVRIF